MTNPVSLLICLALGFVVIDACFDQAVLTGDDSLLEAAAVYYKHHEQLPPPMSLVIPAFMGVLGLVLVYRIYSRMQLLDAISLLPLTGVLYLFVASIVPARRLLVHGVDSAMLQHDLLEEIAIAHLIIGGLLLFSLLLTLWSDSEAQYNKDKKA